VKKKKKKKKKKKRERKKLGFRLLALLGQLETFTTVQKRDTTCFLGSAAKPRWQREIKMVHRRFAVHCTSEQKSPSLEEIHERSGRIVKCTRFSPFRSVFY
jgi:hypothetical protein